MVIALSNTELQSFTNRDYILEVVAQVNYILERKSLHCMSIILIDAKAALSDAVYHYSSLVSVLFIVGSLLQV